MTGGVTSLVAPATDHIAQALAERLGATWYGGDHHERLEAVESGRATVVWLCGLLHAEWADRGGWSATPVVAVASRRPGHSPSPVYFGDVVVRRSDTRSTLAELRGSVLAYNEPGSLSGLQMLRRHLSGLGMDLSFFGTSLETGSHSSSIDAVLSGRADVAVIDSTITDVAGLDHGLRVVEALGPYPAPPFASTTPIDAASLAGPDLVPVDPSDYVLARLGGPGR